MNRIINSTRLRDSMPSLIAGVRKGARYTVLYRGRPAFQIVPVSARAAFLCALENDPLYPAHALGRSKDGKAAEDYDEIIYGT